MSKMQRPGQYDPAHRGTGGTEPSDPNERLKQLQTELDQHNSRINFTLSAILIALGLCFLGATALLLRRMERMLRARLARTQAA